MSKIFTGDIVASGIAFGKAFVIADIEDDKELPKVIQNNDLSVVLDKARAQLEELYQSTLKNVGEEEAEIINVQKMMLDDAELMNQINEKVRISPLDEGIRVVCEQFEQTFAAMEDEYFSARAADIRDLKGRLLDIVYGNESGINLPKNAVVFAEDITPSQTLGMDKEKLAGFVMTKGSNTSHTAILARTLGISAIINTNLKLSEIKNGESVIVDALSGEVVLNASGDVLAQKEKAKAEYQKAQDLLKENIGKESVTKSGRKINLFANIGRPDEAKLALENDAEGIGLFRSEFLFLESSDYPTQDEQYNAYKEVLDVFVGKKVIIRTMDIGADKKVDYFDLEEEANPALGYRAIRISFDREEMFLDQLKALYRAANDQKEAKLGIMFPMIASKWEVEKALEFAHKAAKEVGVDPKIAELGIMIETPAAAIISDELAKIVDFFSVGTNDLTQYTLALDREGSEKLKPYYNAHHQAILRLLEMVAQNAVNAGIWAGICGELGADLELTENFVNYGFTELSVSPKSVLKLRDKIRSLD